MESITSELSELDFFSRIPKKGGRLNRRKSLYRGSNDFAEENEMNDRIGELLKPDLGPEIDSKGETLKAKSFKSIASAKTSDIFGSEKRLKQKYNRSASADETLLVRSSNKDLLLSSFRSSTKFTHASSADESFLNNPYQLHKEIIRLKMEMAQLQADLDSRDSLTAKLSKENTEIKSLLDDAIFEKDILVEKTRNLLEENKKLSHRLKERLGSIIPFRLISSKKIKNGKISMPTIEDSVESEQISDESYFQYTDSTTKQTSHMFQGFEIWDKIAKRNSI